MSIDKLILVKGLRTSCANAEANREDWKRDAGWVSNGMTTWEAAVGEFMLIDFSLGKDGAILAHNCYTTFLLDYMIHTSLHFRAIERHFNFQFKSLSGLRSDRNFSIM